MPAQSSEQRPTRGSQPRTPGGWFGSLWSNQGTLGKGLVVAVLLLLLGCFSCLLVWSLVRRDAAPTATGAPTATATRTATPPAPTVAATRATPTRDPTPEAPTEEPAGTLVVRFIDVGQGDAILIQAPDGSAALIDGGESGSGAAQYLAAAGITRLRYVIATHPDADHIGGLPEVLGAIPADEVVTNGQFHTTLTYERFLDAIAASGAVYTEVVRGDMLELGGLTLEIMHPTSPEGEDMNNQSVVVRLVHGSVAFLFTGDAEAEAEADLLASGQDVRATVLKVAHHGSRSSTTRAFLEGVDPEVAIYSAAEGNSYGHPHAETLALLGEAAVDVYGTDVHGTVSVTSDGLGYTVSTERQGAPRAPPNAELTLEIVSMTSPIGRNADATLEARTLPGAQCAIAVYYSSGQSRAQGLGPRPADGEGFVWWTWRVAPNITPGTWRIVVTASADGDTVTQETTIVVME